jgi:AraC family transcriptional regulator of adaptative response / DNA-3-methyladenine glycosylase II
VELDFDRCYRAVDSRDQRFDGWFVTAVATTGIYCRPSCPAQTPKRENVSFHPTAAAAQRAGYRACRRCRPDAAPGSPEWDVRADLVGRAMRLIADGVVDRDGVGGLAARLGYTTRHVNRLVLAEMGAPPIAIARAQRAQTARTLIETTDLSLTDIAFAAGFGSISQFNDVIHQVYAVPPTTLRDAAHRRHPVSAGTIALRLPYRAPLHAGALLDFLALRAVAGVEEVTAEHYTRAMSLPHGDAQVRLAPLPDCVMATLRLADIRDLAPAVARCRRLLDLDADPVAVDGVLADDPVFAESVRKEPGVRVPRAVDGFEVAMRAIIGQQVSVAGAITVLGRITHAAYRFPFGGAPEVPEPGNAGPESDRAADADAEGSDARGAEARGGDARSTNARSGDARGGDAFGAGLRPFPSATAVASLPDGAFAMPAARRNTIRALAGAIAADDLHLDPGADRVSTEETLTSIPGIGPWTASYIAMRALGDPDVFLPSDLAIRRAARNAGLPDRPASLGQRARRWSPWRSYAVVRLWRM